MRPSELEIMRHRVAFFLRPPRISVLLEVADADEIWIKASASSVLGQIYPHLELCVCDNASARPHVRAVLQRLAASDGRVKTCSLRERGSQAQAYNEALRHATGEYVAILNSGDVMPPETLLEVAEILDHTGADLIYTDEDEIDVAGRPSNPTFKPSWSPDLLLSTDYVGRLSVFRRSILEGLEGFQEGFEGAEEYDLALRFAEKTGRIRHLPGVYYHRRRLPRGTRVANTAAISDTLREALERRGIKAAIETGLAPNSLRVVRDVLQDLRVSAILMAGEASDEHRQRLEENAGYPIHELLVAGSERETPDVAGRRSFPARALNLAAQRARGEYLVFLGERVEPATPDWLLEMLGQAQRPEVGAVGGRLLDASKHSIPAGMALNLTQLTGEPRDSEVADGNYLSLLDHPRNLPVAAKWMAMRRSVFEDAGGFDDVNLPTAFHDLDLSFRLEEAGLLNVYTPYASATYQGGSLLNPGEEEIAYMWVRWWGALVQVLYYSGSLVKQASDRAALDTVRASLSGPAPKI